MCLRFGNLLAMLLMATTLSQGTSLRGQSSTRSGYADATLRGLQRQNSTEQYSISTIQRQNLAQSIGTVGVNGVNARNYSVGQLSTPAPRRKPFSNVQRGPAVSPYLALSNPFATPSDYYSIVKPQQEQQRINQQLARQQYAQEKKLNQVAAQGPYSVTGNEEAAPTGHTSGFMQYGSYLNTGNYFAPATKPKSQQH